MGVNGESFDKTSESIDTSSSIDGPASSISSVCTVDLLEGLKSSRYRTAAPTFSEWRHQFSVEDSSIDSSNSERSSDALPFASESGNDDVEHGPSDFDAQIETIFQQLAAEFGFQNDNMRNQVSFLSVLLSSRSSRMDRSVAVESIHRDYVSGQEANFCIWFKCMQKSEASYLHGHFTSTHAAEGDKHGPDLEFDEHAWYSSYQSVSRYVN